MKNLSINNLMFESFVHHFRSNTLFEQNKMQQLQLQLQLRNKEITRAEYDERLMQNLLQANKINQDDFEKIMQIDNSKEYRRLPWISRQYLKTKTPGNAFDFDELRNTVTEFIALVKSGDVTGKAANIEMYPSFEALQQKVHEINQQPKQVKSIPSNLQQDVVVYLDNKDALVVAPLNHAASRELGMSKFAHRVKDGVKDCAWCITYKNDTHWKSFFDNDLVTFYFAKPKTPQKLQQLQQAFPGRNVQSCAVLVDIAPGTDPESENPDGVIRDGFDADDKKMTKEETKKYLQILGVDV